MKFISWNVNGLRAVCGKGFSEVFTTLDADFFCLQETKMQEGQLDLAFLGYQSYWNYAEKKGYSGTAIYTKHTPLNVILDLPEDIIASVPDNGWLDMNTEGRVITLEYETFFVITVYTPNSQDGLKRLDQRMTWDDAFRLYLQRLDQQKPVLVCGDMNVAHEEMALPTPSDISILTHPTSTHGGAIASMPARRMPVGASTTGSVPIAYNPNSSVPRYTLT